MNTNASREPLLVQSSLAATIYGNEKNANPTLADALEDSGGESMACDEILAARVQYRRAYAQYTLKEALTIINTPNALTTMHSYTNHHAHLNSPLTTPTNKQKNFSL